MKLDVARHATALHRLAIAAAGVAAYSNTFTGEFQFDDYSNIVDNHLLRSPEAFLHPVRTALQLGPIEGPGFLGRLVGYATFALNLQAHGYDVRGFHLVNLAIHLIAALLVYELVRLLLRSPRLEASASGVLGRTLPLLVGLVFVAHPIQTQAVTYIVQRFASLAAMLGMGATVAYLRWRLSPSRSWGGLGLATALMTAAMFTKQNAFTFPLISVAAELLFLEGAWRRRLVGLSPLVATMLIVPATVLWAAPIAELLAAGGARSLQALQLGHVDFLLTELAVVATYLRLLVWPAGQTLWYEYPIYHSLWEPAVLAAAALHLGLSCAALGFFARSKQRPARRLVAFGIFWFYASLAVEAGAVVIVDVIYEHRLYFPSVGFFLAVGAGALLLVERLQARHGWVRPLAGFAAGVLVPSATAASFNRNEVWRTEISLWQDVERKTPASGAGPYLLGRAYLKANRPEEAEAALRRAIAVVPYYTLAYSALARTYFALKLPGRGNHAAAIGRYLELDFHGALQLWDQALASEPSNPNIHYGRGLAFARLGLLSDSQVALARACELGSRQGCEALNGGQRSLPLP